jgi:dTDP-4-dehydrorhamnose 3,5-epimerase-like enzyme
MRALKTRLDGPLLLEPQVHGDERGFFVESYRHSALAEAGVHDTFVQDKSARAGAWYAGSISRSARAKPSWCAARAARSWT